MITNRSPCLFEFGCSWHPGGRRVVGYARRSSHPRRHRYFRRHKLISEMGFLSPLNVPNQNDTVSERRKTIFCVRWSQTIGEEIEHVSAF